MISFHIRFSSRRSRARVGALTTPHGTVPTPAFMPIATRAAVKGLMSVDLRAVGATIILSNTYHLFLQPGLSVIRRAGGLHRFMGWSGPILTDSGGFQVFSLAKFRKVETGGVRFRDRQSGVAKFLTPRLAMAIQATLGSDIAMVLDECVGFPSTQATVASAVARTTRWAAQCLSARKHGQATFAIVQGGTFKPLRLKSARELTALPFDGFAIGGLAVGESPTTMYRVVDWVAPLLPKEKPRYLMGVGKPEQLVQAVARGMDLFDCVLPTRNGRHGHLYVWRDGRIDGERLSAGTFYSELRITQARYKGDVRPIDPHCECAVCRTTSRAYLRHLFATREPLGARLAALHNLHFYLLLMERVRRSIAKSSL